jgi:hypothetical protein
MAEAQKERGWNRTREAQSVDRRTTGALSPGSGSCAAELTSACLCCWSNASPISPASPLSSTLKCNVPALPWVLTPVLVLEHLDLHLRLLLAGSRAPGLLAAVDRAPREPPPLLRQLVLPRAARAVRQPRRRRRRCPSPRPSSASS